MKLKIRIWRICITVGLLHGSTVAWGADTTPPVLTCAPPRTVECGAAWSFDSPTASDDCVFSAIIYDNSANDLIHRFNPGLTEVGDEILLEGTARHLTQFVFEYWGVNASQAEFAGHVEARVRFYANDGPNVNGYRAPRTLLYDSGFFGVAATPRATLIIEDFVLDAAVPLAGPVPGSFTWTVQFAGLGPNDAAGPDLFSPPLVGNGYPDYWERAGEDWLLKSNPAVKVDFAASIAATQEPITIAVVGTETNATCGATLEAVRTWRATDPSGNSTTCSQTVTVVDTTSPALICAPDKTVQCGQAWTFDLPAASDLCGLHMLPANVVVGILSTVTNTGPVAGIWVATRTWVATDLCGNTATCSQKVAIEDTAVPTILCPASVTVNCDAPLPPPDPGSIVASDNCGTPPVVQFAGDVESGTLPRIVTRTYRATDGSGNGMTCQQTITFRNVASVPPTIVQHPRSRTNNVGTTATFSVQVGSCETPVYAWYHNSALLPGETGATLTIPGVSLSDAGTYDAVALNSAGSTSSQAALLTVNRPPIAFSDQVSANTDEARIIPSATLLANDSDAEDDPLRVLSISTPTDQGGSVILNGTDVIYTPPRLFAGADFFFYTVADGRGGFDTTEVEISVASPVLLAPGCLQLLNTVNHQYLLRFKGDATRRYEVQISQNLIAPVSWQAIGTATTDSNGDVEFVVANPPAGAAFFRMANSR